MTPTIMLEMFECVISMTIYWDYLVECTRKPSPLISIRVHPNK